MSEKDIKVKPQTTTKAVKNAPKSVEHLAKQAAWDIKTVAKDTLVKNAIDKQFDTKHSEQPQRAEVEATEQVESTYYSAVDTVYQKGKSLAENKVKQHRQQVKTKDNADTPNTPKADISEVQNTPKQADNTPKTKESVKNTDSAPKTDNSVAQVKTKEAYIKSQRSQKAENTADTVKTKQNYINAHKNVEIKQNPSVSTPKTRENTSVSSAPTPKTKEQAIKDARKKYVSEKLKTKAEAEKSAQENYAANIPKQNAEPVKSLSVDETAYSSKSMPKTKDNYIRSQGKAPSDLIKTPDRSKVMPKQNTHTVTRNVSAGTKKSVKTKDSLLKGTSKAVKTGNSYIGKSAKKKSVKTAKRAAKTQKEITKKAAKQAAKQAKQAAQKAAQGRKGNRKSGG